MNPPPHTTIFYQDLFKAFQPIIFTDRKNNLVGGGNKTLPKPDE